jgi:hypothetical protein
MQTAFFPEAPISANEHVLRALQLNKDHQAGVKTQIEQLENKLAALNKLLVRQGTVVDVLQLTGDLGHRRRVRRRRFRTRSGRIYLRPRILNHLNSNHFQGTYFGGELWPFSGGETLLSAIHLC